MIKFFERCHLNKVLNIWLKGNLSAHSFIPASYWHGNYEKVKLLLPQSDILLYEEDYVIKGFIGIVENIHIAGLFVLAEYQGQGIGRMLLEECKKRYERLVLDVYEKNEKALRFYQNNGFSLCHTKLNGETGELEHAMEWKSS